MYISLIVELYRKRQVKKFDEEASTTVESSYKPITFLLFDEWK